ncbi:MAG: hypothetical protein ACXVR1_15050 [Solirubrobacteraceae bacterium]
MSSYATVFRALPFTAAEAAAVGLSRGRLRVLVRDGRVRPVATGVYVDAAAPDALGLRAAAVAKVVPPEQVICLRTAAWLWGIDALAMGSHHRPPPIDLMAGSGSAAPRRRGCQGRTGPLPDTDVVELQGVLVTTPARTAADLLRLLRRPDALAAVDAMVRGTGVAPAAVADVLNRFGRQRGVVQARELLALADGRAESPQESRTRLRCVDAGFPCPEPQIEVFDEWGLLLGRLDMGYRAWRKAIEFDGDEAHRTVAQLRHDQRRRERVELQGWGLLVVTSEHVLGRGLAFERGVAELLGAEPRLTRHHPRYGGWDRRVPGGL